MRRRVTFSRNLTLSLSRTCRCYCKYCAFATHGAHLYDPQQVLTILDDAARRHIKELLVLTGERPEVNPEVRARLREHGHEDVTAYVAWTCERALEALVALHAEHGHLQGVILQNFVPHQRYYGREPAEIAGAAARSYWRTGLSDGRPSLPLPEWACPVAIDDMKRLIGHARR